MPTPHHPPAAVRRVLRKLGADIHDARRRRRLPMSVVAERAFTSRTTLQRVEAGDTGVGIGIYAAVLQALGLLEGLGQVADISQDRVGQLLASAALPERVRLPQPSGPGSPPAKAPMPDVETREPNDWREGKRTACRSLDGSPRRGKIPV